VEYRLIAFAAATSRLSLNCPKRHSRFSATTLRLSTN